MSVVKGGVGISVQKSKFAALAIDSLSDDDSDDDAKWTQVKPAPAKQKTNTKPKEAGGKDGEKPLSKNAKKRAAKKKRQQNLSEFSDGKTADSADPSADLSWEQKVKMRNQATADLEFQQDLEKAILMSQVEAQEHSKTVEESRLAERIAISESLLLNKPATKSGGKKGVTLSLQEFHREEAPGSQKSMSTHTHSQMSDVLLEDPLPVTPATPSDNFFDRLSESVQKEVVKEERQRKTTRQPDSRKDQPSPEELPRIAQLQDELEKRDALIEKLKKHNELLKKTLKEVKQRNQSLCKILSQGEFSTKTDLIEQVEQLTTVKNELTEEVESLNSSLEQERSKNKALKLELAKHLGGPSKTRSGSSS